MREAAEARVHAEYSQAERTLQEVGTSARGWSQKLMVKECLDRGIEVGLAKNGRAILMREGTRQYTWLGGNTTFNAFLARRVAKYKSVTSRIMRAAGLPFPENAVFRPDEVRAAWDWAQAVLPVVVKPDDGNQGRSVYVGIDEAEDFDAAFTAVSQGQDDVLIEKMLPGTEHRCLVVNDRLVAVTRRRAASVLGDGASSIADLIESKNRSRGPIHLPIELGEIERNSLQRAGLTLETVPSSGERVYLRRNSNIHTGGDAIDATGTLSQDEVELIESVSRRVPGLRLAGFDVLLPRGVGETGVSFIEINANPMISMHHFPWEGESRDVAGAIVDAMFPQTA